MPISQIEYANRLLAAANKQFNFNLHLKHEVEINQYQVIKNGRKSRAKENKTVTREEGYQVGYYSQTELAAKNGVIPIRRDWYYDYTIEVDMVDRNSMAPRQVFTPMFHYSTPSNHRDEQDSFDCIEVRGPVFSLQDACKNIIEHALKIQLDGLSEGVRERAWAEEQQEEEALLTKNGIATCG